MRWQDGALIFQLFMLLVEQTAWRFVLPVVTVIATGISMYLAWMFGATIPENPTMAGLFGAGFASIIVASRCFAIMLDDEKAKAKDDREGRGGLRLAFWGCVALSIFTAASIMYDMQADRMDRRGETAGIAQSAKRAADAAGRDSDIAARAVQDAEQGVRDAEQALFEAEASFDAHKVRAYETYPYKDMAGAAKDRAYANYSWAISTSTAGKGGGGIPYQDAIIAAQEGVGAAQNRLASARRESKAASAVVVAAEAAYRDARRGAASGSVLSSGARLSAEWRAILWSAFFAIMLDVICFAGIGPSRRALSGLKKSREESRAIVGGALSDEPNDEAAEEDDRYGEPIYSEDGGSCIIPVKGPSGGYDKPTRIQPTTPDQRALAEHRETIEAIVARIRDPKNTAITTVSYDAMRSGYGLPNSAIRALHKILINEGLAAVGKGNRVVLK